jgi:hypothetical protein
MNTTQRFHAIHQQHCMQLNRFGCQQSVSQATIHKATSSQSQDVSESPGHIPAPPQRLGTATKKQFHAKWDITDPSIASSEASVTDHHHTEAPR